MQKLGQRDREFVAVAGLVIGQMEAACEVGGGRAQRGSTANTPLASSMRCMTPNSASTRVDFAAPASSSSVRKSCSTPPVP